MNFRELAALTAAVGMSVLVSANAKAATVEEVLQITGDMIAITLLCTDKEPDRASFSQFVKSNGMSPDQFNGDGVYTLDLYNAHQAALQARKAKTMQENCADAEKLYGENGTVIQLKWVDVPPKSTQK